MTELPYRSFSSYLKARFGTRVHKLSLDAGLGCPNRNADGSGGCIYCNPAGSGTGAGASGEPLPEQAARQMQTLGASRGARAFIAYFQSYTNTWAPLPRLKEIYDTCLPWPEIVGLAVGTRPDCVDDEVLELLNSYTPEREVWVEYGLQSAVDETLTRINRGHDVQTFVDAVERTARYNLRQCVHVILGLPGEGPEHFARTADLVASLPLTDLKLHLCYVARDTGLAELYEQGAYTPMERDDYVAAVGRFIACMPPRMVIQRITGDPHRSELVAPQWSLDKGGVRNDILSYMKREGLTQGSMCP